MGVRRRATYALGKIGNKNPSQCKAVITHLSEILTTDKDDYVRLEAALFIQASTGASWREKTDLIIEILQKGNKESVDIDDSNILQAISLHEEQSAENKFIVTDYLINKCLGQEKRMNGILSRLITRSCGGNKALAGERINEYQRKNDVSKDDLKGLRMEIGGEIALGPIMQALQNNLKENFQGPISDLNDRTREMWEETIQRAQHGFLIRVIMSIIVFSFGMVLLSVSAYQFMFGTLRGIEFLGPGVSFASGVAAIIGTVYKGPLNDIQESVGDLGKASAAFIGYIHRVLEISHTFSFYYLHGEISLEETIQLNRLIGEAMEDTVGKLEFNMESTNGK